LVPVKTSAQDRGGFTDAVPAAIGRPPDDTQHTHSYIGEVSMMLPWVMLADLVIIPIGNGTHTSSALAEVLKIIKDSGLPYQLTPASTCIEGTWDEIMAVAKRCHDAVRADSPHLLTMLRLEEDGGEKNKLAENVAAVEEEAGESFEKVPALAAGVGA
jgi:uncharacterized protein (TIGR00106 family)